MYRVKFYMTTLPGDMLADACASYLATHSAAFVSQPVGSFGEAEFLLALVMESPRATGGQIEEKVGLHWVICQEAEQ